MSSKQTRRDGWSRRFPLLPALFITFLLTQFPFLLTLYYSFTNWNLLHPENKKFVGFQNYIDAYNDPIFRGSIATTVLITVAAVFACLIFGLILAILLDRSFFGRGVARTLLITPFLVMPAAGALVWKTTILNPMFGMLNWFLSLFGISKIDWAATYPLPAVIAIVVWQWTPFTMLILLAGLQSQSPEILEAAKVDGASARKIFVNISLPHLRQFIELSVVLGSIYILQTYDQVYLVTQGGPGNTTTTLPYFLYLRTFRGGQIGYASATGIIIVIATIFIASIALRLVASIFRQEGINK